MPDKAEIIKEYGVKYFAPFLHLDSVILEFIRGYFSCHPTYTWDEDETKSGIKITKSFYKVGNDFKTFPRIVVRRGGCSLTNPTQASNFQGRKPLVNFSQERSKFYRAGAPYFIDFITREPGQAQAMAEELMTQLLMYRDRISEKFMVNIEEHMETSQEQVQTNEASNTSFSIITLTLIANYTYITSYKILPMYETLKGVDLTVKLEQQLLKRNQVEYKPIEIKTNINESSE